MSGARQAPLFRGVAGCRRRALEIELRPVEPIVELAGIEKALELLQPREGRGVEHRRRHFDALEHARELIGAALGGPPAFEVGQVLADLVEGDAVAAVVGARRAEATPRIPGTPSPTISAISRTR